MICHCIYNFSLPLSRWRWLRTAPLSGRGSWRSDDEVGLPARGKDNKWRARIILPRPSRWTGYQLTPIRTQTFLKFSFVANTVFSKLNSNTQSSLELLCRPFFKASYFRKKECHEHRCSNDCSYAFVPFWLNRVTVLLLSMLAQKYQNRMNPLYKIYKEITVIFLGSDVCFTHHQFYVLIEFWINHVETNLNKHQGKPTPATQLAS